MDKHCCRCNTTKSISEFHVRRAAPDGLATYCRACCAEIQVVYKGRYYIPKPPKPKKEVPVKVEKPKPAPGMKFCSVCREEKTLSSFNRRGERLRSECKECRAKRRPAERRAHKARVRKTPGVFNAKKVWERLRTQHRAPKWADRKAIQKVYEEAAAKGLIVDHLIPLRGKYVCGLHVLSNLVLTDPISNSMKGAKYPCVVTVNAKRAKTLRRKEKWDTLRASI